MPKPPRCCLSIAGSDPSGGAGIQADIKTFAALGIYGCGVITCLTAQNSRRLSSFKAVDGGFIEEQIGLVLEDLPINHIKIGMVGSKEAATAIARALKSFRGQIIYDPVLKASDGSSLVTTNALSHLMEVVQLATVITPNSEELALLHSQLTYKIEKPDSQAKQILKAFPNLQAVVVTGGHLHQDSDLIEDILVMKTPAGKEATIEANEHRRIATENDHGTGCAFSSAYTAYHLKLQNHQEAFREAAGFMDKLLEVSSPYRGGMLHHLV